jgi:hypothetical protein
VQANQRFQNPDGSSSTQLSGFGFGPFWRPKQSAAPSNTCDFIEPSGFRKGPLEIATFPPEDTPLAAPGNVLFSAAPQQQKAPQARRFFRIVF